MSDWKKNTIIITIIAILIMTSSWAFYQIVNMGVGDLLNKIGITNLYLQGFTVIGFVLILLVVVGYSGKKVVKKILNID